MPLHLYLNRDMVKLHDTLSASQDQRGVSCLWVEATTPKEIDSVRNISSTAGEDVILVVGDAGLIESVLKTGFQKIAILPTAIPQAVPSLLSHLETLRKGDFSVYLCTGSHRAPDEKTFGSAVDRISGALSSLKTSGVGKVHVQVYHPDPMVHQSVNKFFKKRYGTTNIISFIPYDKSENSLINSSLSLGTIFYERIGDAVLVCIPADKLLTAKRIEGAVSQVKKILGQSGLYPQGYTLISCPVCGRCRLDILKMTEQVSSKLKTLEKKYTLGWKNLETAGGITVAVMGCNVNGPGEARQADLGIAGGKGNSGTIFRKGKPVSTLPGKKLLEEFERELEELIREKTGLYSRP
jgi:hypothetical protein